jgi:plastocyanin
MTVVALLAACAGGEDAVETKATGEGTVVIRMTDEMKFVPEHPMISVGDTVVWINEGNMPHTATDSMNTTFFLREQRPGTQVLSIQVSDTAGCSRQGATTPISASFTRPRE